MRVGSEVSNVIRQARKRRAKAWKRYWERRKRLPERREQFEAAARLFPLAHALHPCRSTATELVTYTLCEFPAVWQALKKPIYHHKGVTLQRYFFDASEEWEKEQESNKQKRHKGNIYIPNVRDLLIRYVKFFAYRAIQHSNDSRDTILALGSHMYGHSLEDLGRMIFRIFPKEAEAPIPAERMNKDFGHLAGSVKKRFENYDKGEIAWVPEDSTGIDLALEYFASWETECPELANKSILDLLAGSKVSDPVLSHALIDTTCVGFARLIRSYNKSKDCRLSTDIKLPNFLEDNTGDRDMSDRFNPEPLTGEEMDRILDVCREYSLRRQQFRSSVVNVFVAGEKVAQFDPVEDSAPSASFNLPALASYLKVYGQDDEGPCLLAAFPLYDLQDGDSLRMRLEGGQRLRLDVEMNETTEQFHLTLVYRETSIVSPRTFARYLGRWCEQSVSWLGALYRPRWVPVCSLGLTLILFFSTAYSWRLNLSQRSRVSQSAKQDPSADNESPNSRSYELIKRFTEVRPSRPPKPPRQDLDPIEDYLKNFSEIVRAQVTEGNIEDALGMVDTTDDQYRDFLLIGVVRTLVEMDNVTKAEEVAATIKDTDGQAQALGHIAVAQASVGDFADALKTANTIKDTERRPWTLARIAETQAKARYFDEALKTANTIENADGQAWAWALAQIAAIQASVEDFDEALETANTIEGGFNQDATYAEIAKMQAETRDFEGASGTVDGMENTRGKAMALAEIAVVLAMDNAIEKAMQIVETIQDEFPQYDSPQAKALTEIAKARATKDLKSAVETVNTIEHPYLRAEALAEIAVVLAMDNAIEKAMKIAETIQDEFPRVKAKALSAIAMAQAMAENYDDARATAKTIKLIDEREGVLYEIDELESRAPAG